ncbi:hypothetical protein [Oceanicoccus sp. KOV_DT_Chl]|uniref:hypothetical protein n=1 Tax=Oceanicoccus sp. KOV_DT_Chl TaxID=1904639 RepID=UPI000C7D2E4B|nr:hypothetical protein [Oceanicoccus sp. KOV_DT_Chl]
MKLSTFSKAIITAAALTVSAGAFAAKPTSIKYIEDIVVSNDLIYSHYVVKCSNGVDADISAWDNRKKWCVGKGGQDDCSKKQIKTAKAVCK